MSTARGHWVFRWITAFALIAAVLKLSSMASAGPRFAILDLGAGLALGLAIPIGTALLETPVGVAFRMARPMGSFLGMVGLLLLPFALSNWQEGDHDQVGIAATFLGAGGGLHLVHRYLVGKQSED